MSRICSSVTAGDIPCGVFIELEYKSRSEGDYRGLDDLEAEKLFVKRARKYGVYKRTAGVVSAEHKFSGKRLKGMIINHYLSKIGYKRSKTIVLDLYHTFLNTENVYDRFVRRKGLPYTTKRGRIYPARSSVMNIYPLESVYEVPVGLDIARNMRQEVYTISSRYERNVELHIAIDSPCDYGKHVESRTDIPSLFEFFVDNTFFVNMGIDSFIRGVSGDVSYMCGKGFYKDETARMEKLRVYRESRGECNMFELELRYTDRDYGTNFNKSFRVANFDCIDMNSLRTSIHNWILKVVESEFKYNTYDGFVAYKSQSKLKTEEF